VPFHCHGDGTPKRDLEARSPADQMGSRLGSPLLAETSRQARDSEFGHLESIPDRFPNSDMSRMEIKRQLRSFAWDAIRVRDSVVSSAPGSHGTRSWSDVGGISRTAPPLRVVVTRIGCARER